MKVKRGVSFFLGLGLVFAGAVGASAGSVYAEGECTVDGEASACMATTYAELVAGLENENVGTITLGEDIALEGTLISSRDLNFDLAGRTLSYDGEMLDVTNGLFSVTDSVGGGSFTTTMKSVNGTVIVEGETATFSLQGGAINADAADGSAYGVYALDGGTVAISGGEINTYYGACLGGNNTTGDMNFYVSGGVLNSEVQTIYMPGQVKLTISGGELNGGVTARMGQIDISGGVINAIDNEANIDSIEEYYDYSGMAWLPDALTILGGTYTSGNVTYGNSLNLKITGGIFNVENAQGRAVAIYDLGKVAQTMNAVVEGGLFEGEVALLDVTDITETPKAGYGAIDNEATLTITGGDYTVAPDESTIPEDMELEESWDGQSWEVLPKKVEEGVWMGVYEGEDDELYYGEVELDEEIIADRKASLAIVPVVGEEGDEIKALDDGIVAIFDLDVVDRDGVKIEIGEDNTAHVYLQITEEQYNELSKYDKVEVYYIEDGEVKERIPAELSVFGGDGRQFYEIVFTTTHFSTYALAGVNEEETVVPAAANTGRFTGIVEAAKASHVELAMLAVAMILGGVKMIEAGIKIKR